MATCKLKKGDKIYECRYREGTLIELITDPILEIQPGGSHYWHWQAKIVSTGQIIDYGISEEAPQYGPHLYRQNIYEVGIGNAEPVLPPFDTCKEENNSFAKENDNIIRGISFNVDGRDVYCYGFPELDRKVGFAIGDNMALFGKATGPLYIANIETGALKLLVDHNSHAIGFGEQDFDWEKLESVEHKGDLNARVVGYGGLGRCSDFQNGVCCLTWTLYPDGRYFADEDGYGMKDNEEEKKYCIIDCHFRILVPFQPMTYKERQNCLKNAIETLNNKGV